MIKVCKTEWCYDCKDQTAYDKSFEKCDICHNPLVLEPQMSLIQQMSQKKKEVKKEISDADQLAYWEDMGSFNKY